MGPAGLKVKLGLKIYPLSIQLSNSLVQLCVSDLDSYCSHSHDRFWSLVSEAVRHKAHPPPAKPAKDTAAGKTLLSKLESYLHLSTTFKSFLAQLRETFLSQQVNFSLAPVSKKVSSGSMRKVNASTRSTSTDESAHGVLTQHTSGISLQSGERIMSGMSGFTAQVSHLLELVSTLAEYTRLNLEHRLNGLPRFTGLWTLQVFEDSEEERSESLGQSFNQSEGMSLKAGTVMGRDGGSVSDVTLATPDYLDMLVSRNVALQQQGVGPGGGAGGRGEGLHSGALSVLKEESCDGEEEEKSGTQEGMLETL